MLFDNALIGDAYGTVQLLVEFYPQLAADGGAITLQLGKEIAATTTRGYSVPIDNTILVINQSGTFNAVQSSCPHASCPLGYNKAAQQIECPCHSSRFQANPRRGGVRRACSTGRRTPALLRWQTKTTTAAGGTLLVIDLKQTLLFNCSELPAVDAMMKLTLPLADFPQLGDGRRRGVRAADRLVEPDHRHAHRRRRR